jgi:hypothetical protein
LQPGFLLLNFRRNGFEFINVAVTDQPITGQVMSISTPMYYRVAESPSVGLPDLALQQYLAANGYDQNGDYVISGDEVTKITRLFLVGSASAVLVVPPMPGASSLDFGGLTYLVDLRIAYATQVTNVIVSACSQLKTLYLWIPELPALDISSNRNLDFLYFHNAGMTNLNTAGAANLRYIKAESARLQRLDISASTNLDIVDITDTTGYALEEVTVWWNPSVPPPLSTFTYHGQPIFGSSIVIRNP